jgi:hypothetical protein
MTLMKLALRLELLSDATFGRGNGVAGLLDQEVEHDPETGLPLVRGRTLKGLLVEDCSDLLFALQLEECAALPRLEAAAAFLFGVAGSTLTDDARLHIGPALLPTDLRRAVAADVRRNDLRPADVLESLTAIRRQTAVEDTTGAPDLGSLRSQRVVLRGLAFSADLEFLAKPSPDALGLLAACVKALRRGGTGRNRGRGGLKATLHENEEDVTERHFAPFRAAVAGGSDP